MSKGLKATFTTLLPAFIFALISSNVHAEKLDLSEGTMTIFGKAQVSYHSLDINSFGTFYYDIDWGFGYFAADNFLVGFDLVAGGNFNTTAYGEIAKNLYTFRGAL